MHAGRELRVSEMAKLMGQDIGQVDLRFTSEIEMCRMLGMRSACGDSRLCFEWVIGCMWHYIALGL